MSRKTLLNAIGFGVALSACATPDPLTAPPDWMDIRILEELRILAPLARSTQTEGKFLVEAAPKIETRNTRCTPADYDTYACAFETRIKPAGAPAGPWEKRSETLDRDSRGIWWFARSGSGQN